MNEMQKLGAMDAFLRSAAGVDPAFAVAERRWHRAKAHVAKGHDEERRRLVRKGAVVGTSLGSNIASLAAMRRSWPQILAANVGGGVIGALAGARVGAWEADKRLALSQRRGAHGQYAPLTKGASAAFGGLSALAPATNTVVGQTMSRARSALRATRRAAVKPVAHKPMVVRTPTPQAPRVEPTTLTPNMQPLAKSAARDRVAAGTPPTGGRAQRPGEDMRTRRRRPGNEPVTFTNGRPRDF